MDVRAVDGVEQVVTVYRRRMKRESGSRWQGGGWRGW